MYLFIFLFFYYNSNIRFYEINKRKFFHKFTPTNAPAFRCTESTRREREREREAPKLQAGSSAFSTIYFPIHEN